MDHLRSPAAASPPAVRGVWRSTGRRGPQGLPLRQPAGARRLPSPSARHLRWRVGPSRLRARRRPVSASPAASASRWRGTSDALHRLCSGWRSRGRVTPPQRGGARSALRPRSSRRRSQGCGCRGGCWRRAYRATLLASYGSPISRAWFGEAPVGSQSRECRIFQPTSHHLLIDLGKWLKNA